MGYMEGNLSSMDYSYGGTATHYPLWKPPSGYFPRGEAPPPYEEAVAISQAEALSAQCAAAAAAAAAAVATQRPVNAVELQSSVDINRRPQAAATMQQLQHLQSHQTSLVPQQTSQHSASQSHQASAHNVMPIHHVLGAPQSHQQNQNHQITQSTTNLINININSGGNITTIATGENHQPPYSLQNEQNTNNMVQEQRPHASATQQNPQQVINTSNSNTNDNGDQLHLAQSNSICVQTVTTQPNIQQQYQQATGGQAVSSSNVSNPVGISASGKGIAAAECGYKNCHLNTNVTTTATATSTSARRTQRLPEPLQQYVVDVEVNVGNTTGSGYHSLPPCTANPANEGEFELIASPTQFANDSQMTNVLSTQAINSLIPTNNVVDVATNNTGADVNSQLLNTSHHTLPTHNTQTVKSLAPLPSNTATITKTPSSSRRYHRTMPRYYTAADPLTNRDNQSTANNATSNTSKSSKQMESKQTPNTNSANSVATAINSNSAKKPTCQCPIQHVPMSYMGSTHLNSQNVTNNAFFTVLSNKLNTGTVSRISNTNNNTSSLPYSSQRLNKTLQNHLTNTTTENNVSNTNSNSKRGTLQSHCNYESKIATISTGELVNSTTSNNTGSAHHHHSHHNHHHGHHSSSSLLPPPQHHDDSSPLVMGRVTKRSSSNSSDRFRSASSGSTRNPVNEAAAGIAGAYLNSKVDAYLNLSHATTTPHHHTAAKINDLMNPALPPKLHKSLTNLKSSTLATSTPHHAGSGTVRNMNKTSEIIKVNNGQLLRNNNINNSINTHTTLTSTTSSTSSVSPSSSNLGSPQTSSNNLSTTSVQTIYTLSKPSTTAALTTLNGVSTVAHVRNRDHDHLNLKIQPPILTLPSSSSATMTSTTSGGTNTGGTKINSSTFYPLQNNVTYTLPKNIAGKMSLNSTINSVVSKVPSVISLPPTASSNNNQENAANTVVGSNCNESSSAAITTSVKSTTLPKILRSKKDFLHSNTAVNSNSSSASNNYTTIASSTACAISQCNMPPYPKLFNTFNNSNSLISTVSNSSSSFSPSQTTTTTTNVAVVTTTQQCINMQTQTITSTLAGNLYVDDFFTSSSPTSNSSGNCKQTALPAACTTSKNYLNPKEHFLPNDASLDDDYLSECENCKIAQSTKYYLDTAALLSTPQETMTLQRKSLEENKEEPETGYYRISHTLPSNSKKNTPLKSINNREPWFSTIPAASSSSDEDINE